MDRHQLSESSGLDLQLWFYHTLAFVQGAILLLYQLIVDEYIPGLTLSGPGSEIQSQDRGGAKMPPLCGDSDPVENLNT